MSTNCRRIFVGDLPADVKGWEVEELFKKFGRIVQVDLVMTREGRRSPPFAFVEFEERRSVQHAIDSRNGVKFGGSRIRVSVSRDSSQARGGGEGSGSSRGDGIGRGFRPFRRTNYRVLVTGLPRGVSFQDLKEHMRGAGDVCFVDIRRDGSSAYVEYAHHRHTKKAVEMYDGSKYPSKEGDRDSSKIRVEEDPTTSSSRRSGERSRSRSRNRTYSPVALVKRSPRDADGVELQPAPAPQPEYTYYYDNYYYE